MQFMNVENIFLKFCVKNIKNVNLRNILVKT